MAVGGVDGSGIWVCWVVVMKLGLVVGFIFFV